MGFNKEEYEYKAPSYERKARPHRVTMNDIPTAEESRFYPDGEIYKSKAPEKDEISLLFAGDLLCQENMIEAYQTTEGGYDFTSCYDYVRPLFKAADFVAGNLETVISEEAPFRGEIITHEGPFFCNAPTEYLTALKYAGFDMLTTANNHTIDAGCDGVYDTIQNIRKFDFIQTGTFIEKAPKYVIVDICGIKVGFTAFSTTYNMQEKNLTLSGRKTLLNTFTEAGAKKICEELREKGAEYIVCFPHWGAEYTERITDRQKEIAEYLAEVGYDFIAGSHAHIVQKYDEVHQKPVVYSMGNLMSHMSFASDPEKIKPYTLLCQLNLKRTADGIHQEFRFIPCRIFRKLHKVPYQVIPYDRNLVIPPEAERKLSGAPRKVARLLNVEMGQLNLGYPVSPVAVKELEELKQRQASRLASLKPRKKTPPGSSQKQVRHQQLINRECSKGGKVADYIEHHSGIYRKRSDYLELLYFTKPVEAGRIPEEIEGLPVRIINNSEPCSPKLRVLYMGTAVQEIKKSSFAQSSNLESVRFYNALVRIGAFAFAECPKLTGIILPKSLKVIEKKAFFNCSSLLSVKIPDNVTRIARNAFSGCPKLVIYCTKGSYADKYAKRRRIPVKYMPL